MSGLHQLAFGKLLGTMVTPVADASEKYLCSLRRWWLGTTALSAWWSGDNVWRPRHWRPDCVSTDPSVAPTDTEMATTRLTKVRPANLPHIAPDLARKQTLVGRHHSRLLRLRLALSQKSIDRRQCGDLGQKNVPDNSRRVRMGGGKAQLLSVLHLRESAEGTAALAVLPNRNNEAVIGSHCTLGAQHLRRTLLLVGRLAHAGTGVMVAGRRMWSFRRSERPRTGRSGVAVIWTKMLPTVFCRFGRRLHDG